MMDSDEKFGIVILIIACATILGLAGLLVCNGDEINAKINASKTTVQDAFPAIEHANGCPLDAVSYDAPKFASNGSVSLKVVDRLSGDSWWLVKMSTKWVVLPIESKEAGK